MGACNRRSVQRCVRSAIVLAAGCALVLELGACAGEGGPSPGASGASSSSAVPWPWSDANARERIIWIVPDPAPAEYLQAYAEATDPTVRRVFEDGRLTSQETKELLAEGRRLQDECLARHGIITSDDPNEPPRWDDAHQDRVGTGMDEEQQLCALNREENALNHDYDRILNTLRQYWIPSSVDRNTRFPDSAYWEVAPETATGTAGTAE